MIALFITLGVGLMVVILLRVIPLSVKEKILPAGIKYLVKWDARRHFRRLPRCPNCNGNTLKRVTIDQLTVGPLDVWQGKPKELVNPVRLGGVYAKCTNCHDLFEKVGMLIRHLERHPE